MLEIKKAKYISGFTLWLSFDDGTEGNVDLENSLWGPVFEPLKDIDKFQQVSLSESLHTITWPNDADFAPEFLKDTLIEQSRAPIPNKVQK
ncbi:MAG: DUF2442 domain-containing protein [Kiritimatiellae bacterium]|nr:DUF2442 domain-containing protein [Kiritimatiellia bacterium]